MCHKEKNHKEHQEIGTSYVGKIKIYLNDTKPKILLYSQRIEALADKKFKFGCTTLLFRMQIKPHIIYFQI